MLSALRVSVRIITSARLGQSGWLPSAQCVSYPVPFPVKKNPSYSQTGAGSLRSNGVASKDQPTKSPPLGVSGIGGHHKVYSRKRGVAQ